LLVVVGEYQVEALPRPERCPDVKNVDVCGVHDADEEPGISGGVVGKVSAL
jgi:hypothetical protein